MPTLGNPGVQVGDGIADRLPELVERRSHPLGAVALKRMRAERKISRGRFGRDERQRA